MKAAEILNILPSELIQNVLITLTAFDSVIIDFENGNFKIGSLSLRDKYPSDFRHIGVIKNTDVYTKEQIEENIKNL